MFRKDPTRPAMLPAFRLVMFQVSVWLGPARVLVLLPPLIFPEMLPFGKKANWSLPLPPVRFSKEENVEPLTEPALTPLIFQVAPASGPINVSAELLLPTKLVMLLKVPVILVAVPAWRLTVTGPAVAE